MQFHASATVWIELTIAYGEVGVVFSECSDVDDASREGVLTMTPTSCLAEALF